nr:MAG TPA: helix-turn-helix domain protein [Bacteriophage sp.]
MGRSQEEFSKMIGVDTRTLQRIEANKNPPKKKTFDLIVQLRKEYFW